MIRLVWCKTKHLCIKKLKLHFYVFFFFKTCISTSNVFFYKVPLNVPFYKVLSNVSFYKVLSNVPFYKVLLNVSFYKVLSNVSFHRVLSNVSFYTDLSNVSVIRFYEIQYSWQSMTNLAQCSVWRISDIHCVLNRIMSSFKHYETS